MARGYSQRTIMFLEMGRAAEDAAAGAFTRGWQGAILGATNNIAALAVAIDPLAGAIVGMTGGVILASMALYNLSKAADTASKEIEAIEAAARARRDQDVEDEREGKKPGGGNLKAKLEKLELEQAQEVRQADFSRRIKEGEERAKKSLLEGRSGRTVDPNKIEAFSMEDLDKMRQEQLEGRGMKQPRFTRQEIEAELRRRNQILPNVQQKIDAAAQDERTARGKAAKLAVDINKVKDLMRFAGDKAILDEVESGSGQFRQAPTALKGSKEASDILASVMTQAVADPQERIRAAIQRLEEKARIHNDLLDKIRTELKNRPNPVNF